MNERWTARGITLVEILVVMVLIAILSSIVGPSIAGGLDSLSLRTTATQLSAEFRKAQALARIEQTPVAAVYDNHEFRFLMNKVEVASYTLASSILADCENGATYLFLPAGQILGPENLELRNHRGRRSTIHMDFITGISINSAQATR